MLASLALNLSSFSQAYLSKSSGIKGCFWREDGFGGLAITISAILFKIFIEYFLWLRIALKTELGSEVDKTLPCLHRCDDTRLHNVEVCQSEETKRSSRVQTLLIPVVGAAFVVLAPFVSVLEGPIDSQQIKGLESWFVPLKHRVLLLWGRWWQIVPVEPSWLTLALELYHTGIKELVKRQSIERERHT